MTGLYATGTPVRYWPGFRDGPSKIGRISSGPGTVGGTRCFYIAGAGAVSAGHIEALPFSAGVIEVETAEEALLVAGWLDVLTVQISKESEREKMRKVVVKLV